MKKNYKTVCRKVNGLKDVYFVLSVEAVINRFVNANRIFATKSTASFVLQVHIPINCLILMP